MFFRFRLWLAAFGLSLLPSAAWSAALPAAEPPRLEAVANTPLPSTAANQRMADLIAGQVRQSALLHHYTVDIHYEVGSVEVTGVVDDQSQRDEVMRIVQGVPGVERVVDHLTVAGTIRTVQAPMPPGPNPDFPPAPVPAPNLVPPPANNAPAPPEPNIGNQAPEAVPAPGAAADGGKEPVPIFAAPAPSPYSLNPPKMPPYAWPTYAPYNNFSRVATPLAYPYNAWPFIGPFYPFPKVPLGWRSVKLEWQDGKWWFSKVGNKYDWWRLRFW